MTPPPARTSPKQGQGQAGLLTDLSDTEMAQVQAFASANGLSLDEASTDLARLALANRHLGRRLAPAAVLQFGAMRQRVRGEPSGPAA